MACSAAPQHGCTAVTSYGRFGLLHLLTRNAFEASQDDVFDWSSCCQHFSEHAQRRIAAGALNVDIDWWAPHAPEPATFEHWLDREVDRVDKRNEPIIVLHPDPPLGPDERDVLVQIGRLAGLEGPFEFLTPRGLAVHGG